MDALAYIYIYIVTLKGIMKKQSGSLGFGIQGKISVYIYFMFYALAIFYFLFLEFM